MSITFIPYDHVYDSAIHQLENSIVQGKKVKLTIVKDNYLDRSIPFEKSYPLLAVNDTGELVGTCAGAYTEMVINGKQFTSGFVYDVKVDQRHRNKGIGRKMASYCKHLFTEEGHQKNFTTLKLSNVPVVRLTKQAIKNIWLYPFVYLTIPVNQDISESAPGEEKSNFTVSLFHPGKLSTNYYSMFESGLGCFYTHKLYRLRIQKINPLLKQALKLYKVIYPHRYQLLPKEKEEMTCATLFNHSAANIKHVAEVLESLRTQGIGFLSVCCRRKDAIYNYLKKYSISTYPYYLLADFPLERQDKITVDVRCL
jgi:GNAT superfamily N-acetyltransferase